MACRAACRTRQRDIDGGAPFRIEGAEIDQERIGARR